MMKLKNLYFILGLVLVAIAFMVSKQTIGVSADTDPEDFSVSKLYQDGVPQFDKEGKVTKQYSPSNFFPIGIYFPEDEQDLENIDKAGFNLFYLHSTKPADFDSKIAYIEKKGLNLKVIRAGANQYFGGENCQISSYSNCLDFFKNCTIEPKTSVFSSADQENVFAWNIVDEPFGGCLARAKWDSDGEEVVAGYRELAEKVSKASGKNVFLNNTAALTLPEVTLDWWSKFANIGDFASHDNYQIGSEHPDSFNFTVEGSVKSTIPQSVRKATEAVNSQKPNIFVAQTHLIPSKVEMPSLDCNRYDDLDNGCRGDMEWITNQEQKLSVYSAIINGATGLVYYQFDNPKSRNISTCGRKSCLKRNVGIAPDPKKNNASLDCNGSEWYKCISDQEAEEGKRLWDNVIDLNKEISELKPVILSKTSVEKYKVTATGGVSQTPIMTMLKQYNGSYYLIVANHDNRRVNSKITFNRALFKNPKKIFKQFTDDEIAPINQNSFEEEIEEFGVRIYRWSIDSQVISIPLKYSMLISNSDESMLSTKNFFDGTNSLYKFDPSIDGWRKATKENKLDVIEPGLGYYARNQGNTIKKITFPQKYFTRRSVNVAQGWNLLANNFSSDKRLDQITVNYKGEDRTIAELFSDGKVYKAIYEVKDPRATTAKDAFEVITLTDGDLDQLKISKRKMYWLYLKD